MTEVKLAVLGGSGAGKSGKVGSGVAPVTPGPTLSQVWRRGVGRGGRKDLGKPGVRFLPAALAVRFLTRRFIGEYASNAGELRRALGRGRRHRHRVGHPRVRAVRVPRGQQVVALQTCI